MTALDKMARDFRFHVRKKAGLDTDWDSCSEEMKEWYRYLAKRTVER